MVRIASVKLRGPFWSSVDLAGNQTRSARGIQNRPFWTSAIWQVIKLSPVLIAASWRALRRMPPLEADLLAGEVFGSDDVDGVPVLTHDREGLVPLAVYKGVTERMDRNRTVEPDSGYGSAIGFGRSAINNLRRRAPLDFREPVLAILEVLSGLFNL